MFHLSSVFLVVEPSRIIFLIQKTIPQKEDIILVYMGYSFGCLTQEKRFGTHEVWGQACFPASTKRASDGPRIPKTKYLGFRVWGYALPGRPNHPGQNFNFSGLTALGYCRLRAQGGSDRSSWGQTPNTKPVSTMQAIETLPVLSGAF